MKLFIITGTCGAGKSTMKDELATRLDSGEYTCIDSDETGLNWRDYAQPAQSRKTDTARTACGRRSGSPTEEIWSLSPA